MEIKKIVIEITKYPYSSLLEGSLKLDGEQPITYQSRLIEDLLDQFAYDVQVRSLMKQALYEDDDLEIVFKFIPLKEKK